MEPFNGGCKKIAIAKILLSDYGLIIAFNSEVHLYRFRVICPMNVIIPNYSPLKKLLKSNI